MTHPIQHVTQTLPNNCVSACIAMVTGFSIDKVTEEFHHLYQTDWEWDEHRYLKQNGVPCELLSALFRIPEEGYVYIAVVPSLNIRGGSHSIVICYTDEYGFEIFDPCMGKEGKYYYVNGPIENEYAFQISSYQCCVHIKIEELLSWRASL